MDFKYTVVCAHSYPEYGIGNAGRIPWHLKADLIRFRQITTLTNSADEINTVVMGRATFESLPVKVRPLPNRLNIIITNNAFLLENLDNGPNTYYCTWDNLVTTLCTKRTEFSTGPIKLSNNVFIAGGADIYKLALTSPTITIHKAIITEVYLNEKKNLTGFDKYFPEYNVTNWIAGSASNPVCLRLSNVSNFHVENGIIYRYLEFYDNVPPGLEWCGEEQKQYLEIMRSIIDKGIENVDRTQVGTISVFGTRQQYDLSDTFPLCTTKRMFFRAIFEELALYLSGKTDNKILQDKGIHIWDGNTSREFLDKRGLTDYPEGDMGETYGFNFRHYGAEYTNCKAELPLDGTVGYDQIQNIIHLLRIDPSSRRMIINLWNPATQHKASLPACLMMYQFYVNSQLKTLSCQIYLRSSDYFLANNWNVCTGALLVHMLCMLDGINLTPGELIIITGDTHIYKTHIKQANTNLARVPFPFPHLSIAGGKRTNILDIKFEDLKLTGYKCHPAISADMAV